ncbi:MAG: FAD-dependent oxidoreductase [Firmicutes bacterium]|nr:FAD-dependent oxidoreductase [Bacillota bacterium]
MKVLTCDILVVGGGTGGTAAALRASSMGRRVVITEETRWLGGQMTSQGVSALDEHEYIESFGGTALYNEFRRRVRDYYRRRYRLRRDRPDLNPGNGWVSRLCFEPRVGVAVLEEMLRPAREAGLLTVLYEVAPVAVEREGDRIRSVTVEHLRTGEKTRIEAAVVIDATELGDLLPLAGVPYRTGMESYAETHEPSAPPEGNPEAVQAFTFPFAVEYRPGERHVIPKPEGYEAFRDRQPFSLHGYKMFAPGGPIGLPFWTYRRLIDASQFEGDDFPHDIAMINWPANDYAFASIIDKPRAERARILDEAKRLSLSFLYWLQTEAPRDDGGRGYPELKLRPDVMGTEDGLSMYPYIRESRRIQAYETVREQDIVAAYNPGSRARLWPDSVGLGLYLYIDIHRSVGTDLTPGAGQKVRPFQIPLGALLSPAVANLIAGAKNLGVTHITNGAFRLHPVEWNVGESAGALAAFALDQGVAPDAVYHNRDLLRRFQLTLLRHGIPLYWFTDVPQGHPAFVAVQYLAVTGVIQGEATDLLFRPDEPVTGVVAGEWAKRAGVDLTPEPGETRAGFARRLAAALGLPLDGV